MVAETQYKMDIVERLGGKATFDFAVVALAQRIQEDPELRVFHKKRPVDDLILEQEQFLTAVFSKHPDNFNLKNFVLLRHYALIQRGFNVHHFDLLVNHFQEELEGSWVNSIATQDAVKLLNEVRSVFESSSSCSSSCSSTEQDDLTWVSSERSLQSQSVEKSKTKKSSKSTQTEPSEKSRRGSSGEFLLNMIRGKGTKRTK